MRVLNESMTTSQDGLNDIETPSTSRPAFVWPAPLVHSADEPVARRAAHHWRLVSLVLLASVLGGAASYGLSRGSPSTTSAARSLSAPVAVATTAAETKAVSGTLAAVAAGRGLDIHTLIAKVSPSVVSIEIKQQGRAVSAGSGVVVSSNGLVITNAHVVDLTDQYGRKLTKPTISVRLPDGSERAATIVGAAPSNDIALVRVADTAGLVPVTIGNSDKLEVGDDVVAIGNALDLGATPTVTKGIISAKNRTLQVDANTELSGLLQTDAAINHGNSGGALLNASGQLVGLNSAGISDAQNIGFAIASNTFMPLIAQLQNN